MKRRAAIAASTIACLGLGLGAATATADFRDAPALVDIAAAGQFDAGPPYVFRSPTNANNTVLVMTVSPFAGNVTPDTFARNVRYDIKIDRNADGVEDWTFRTTFGAAAADGSQPMLMRCLPRYRCRRHVLARGRTRMNVPVVGGGQVRASIQDNPVYFDQAAWDDLAGDGAGTFPRAGAKNFFGANGNVLAIVIELPSSRLGANNDLIGVWTRVASGGQIDREGRPFVNLGMLPRLPRQSMSQTDQRNAFNAAVPRPDRTVFKTAMTSVLTMFWGRSAADANAIADIFLPDYLVFQLGNPNGLGTFVVSGTGNWPGTQLGNGRRLRDDAYDFVINIVSNGGITTDNVADDNGTRITDGNMATTAAFPYIGAVNLPLNGPGTGPNP